LTEERNNFIKLEEVTGTDHLKKISKKIESVKM